MQNLIIWRHAEAAEGTKDLERRLTKKGRQQAEKMAKWLKKNCPFDYQVYTSAAVRTRQTARFLKHPHTSQAVLNPDGELMPIVDFVFAKLIKGENLLVVGHQPWLGQLASYLLLNQYRAADNVFDSIVWYIKKGGIWWFEIQMINHSPTNYSYYCKVRSVMQPV